MKLLSLNYFKRINVHKETIIISKTDRNKQNYKFLELK